MCDCIQKIASIKSKEYTQNGVNACVQASVKGEISIAQFVVEGRPYRDKILRRSEKRKYEGIKFNFCPVCGEKWQTNQHRKQSASVWHDA